MGDPHMRAFNLSAIEKTAKIEATIARRVAWAT